jgi:hypothetical protein
MRIVGLQVNAERAGRSGFTVEFIGDGDEVVTVMCPQDKAGSLNRLNAIAKAKEILHAAIAADETVQPLGSICEEQSPCRAVVR